MNLPLILASESPSRLALLKQINLNPDLVVPANIDEQERKKELGRDLALRLSKEKANSIVGQFSKAIIVAADTVPVVGRRILRKAKTSQDIKENMMLLSNRRHRIYTGICVIKKDHTGSVTVRNHVVKSIIKFKHISNKEIEYYSSLSEGIGKSGGYDLSGYAGSFTSFISGSFSNILGLPLFEASNMIRGFMSSKGS